jgi:hypothetical protein
MSGQSPRPQDGRGHDQPEPGQAGVEVEIQPGIPRHRSCRDGWPVAGALDHIQPQIFGLSFVLIRIVDQMRAAPEQRGLAGEHLAGAVEQGIDLGKVRLPGIGIIGKGLGRPRHPPDPAAYP